MPRLIKTLYRRFHKPSQLVVAACRNVFTLDLTAVVLKGSAVRGDFIPYYSDLDLHVFLRDKALIAEGTPRLEDALFLQSVIGGIDLASLSLSSIQLSFNNADRRSKVWSPTPKEVARILYGEPPSYDLDRDDWRQVALTSLDQLGREGEYEVRSFADSPDNELARRVRRQGVFLKGGSYNLAALLMNSFREAQLLTYWELDEYLCKETSGKVDPSKFHAYAERWKIVRGRPALLRSMFRTGLKQLLNIHRFTQGYASSKE